MMFRSIDSNIITANVYKLNLLLLEKCEKYTPKHHQAYVAFAHDVLEHRLSNIITANVDELNLLSIDMCETYTPKPNRI